MKRFLVKKISDLLNPGYVFDLDVYEVLESLQDPVVRKDWLFEVLWEIKRINLEIDKKLNGDGPLTETILADLSGRRRAFQFILETALASKNKIQRSRGHNPASKGTLDLDSVTLQPGL